MTSGLSVAEECVTVYHELKLENKWRYVLYKISDDKISTIVDKKGGSDLTYSDFILALKETGKPRYAVFNLDFLSPVDGGNRRKVLFILWVPETSGIKDKMIYTSFKDALRTCFVGIAAAREATEESQIEDLIETEKK